jgi:hypothetical protein
MAFDLKQRLTRGALSAARIAAASSSDSASSRSRGGRPKRTASARLLRSSTARREQPGGYRRDQNSRPNGSERSAAEPSRKAIYVSAMPVIDVEVQTGSGGALESLRRGPRRRDPPGPADQTTLRPLKKLTSRYLAKLSIVSFTNRPSLCDAGAM